MGKHTSFCGTIAAAVLVVCSAGSVANADTVVPIVGTDSQNDLLVGFEGSIAYNSAAKDVTITLTNTSAVTSVITGFVFNIAADVSVSYVNLDNVTTAAVDEGAWALETNNTAGQDVSGPFGVWDAGAALLDLSQQQIKGVGQGETGVFRFLLSGTDAGALNADAFLNQLNTADGLSSFFLARFQSVGGSGSDRMVDGNVVPLPGAVWGGMVLLGGLGITKGLRRRREKAAEAA